jgi:hypothetical protein
MPLETLRVSIEILRVLLEVERISAERRVPIEALGVF